MGNTQASTDSLVPAPLPDSSCDATLYYFGGRGMADQVRWMLAATKVTFSQTLVSDRETFLRLSETSLMPFRQIPVLQIDGQVLAQSQAMVRYLAKRGDLAGTHSIEAMQMDMLAEFISDMLGHLVGACFTRVRSPEEWEEKKKVICVKWSRCAHKLEQILQHNISNTMSTTESNESSDKSDTSGGGSSSSSSDGDGDVVVFLVGRTLSYVDILAAHLLTWAMEELTGEGANSAVEVVRTTPRLVDLQRYVVSLPHMAAFIRSDLYYPLGDEAYVKEVMLTLGREIS